MKAFITIFLIATYSCFLVSCSTITSSYHYTKGTECLEKRDIPGAINELTQAVKDDPSMARNHTNLSVAYRLNNDYEKAWYYCRQATLSQYDDGLCQLQFRQFCKELIIDQGLNISGTDSKEIIVKLGAPDEIKEDRNHQIIFCSYGTCEMFFENGMLTKCIY